MLRKIVIPFWAWKTASQDGIERLYKRLALQHHPDRGGDAEEMKAINEALDLLQINR